MKSRLLALLSIMLLAGCAYQAGVLEDRADEKTAKPGADATTIDTPAPLPAVTEPVSPSTNAQKAISPITGG